ncbi:MAG: extracellular solute-binding protein [Clostridia bacterium]|nr:extracellular solute-binding protein [Clostridia bacterium]
MRTKKILSMLMVVAMTFTVLSGCSPAKKTGKVLYDGEYTMDPVLNPLGSDTICKETVELEIMTVPKNSVIDYTTNKYTKEIEKKGNVKLNLNLLSSADYQQQINLSLSTGKDLPDVLIHALSDADAITYSESGIFIPLNKYYENSSEYLVPQAEKWREETGFDMFKYITMTDGNIYTVPQYNESLVNGISTVLWIYKPWLDKLGMEVPTTLEELETALQAFKDNDMNGNGNPNDEIPMLDENTQNKGLVDILQSYIQTGEDDLVIKEDGTLDYAFVTDEYKEFLKYMRNLTKKGLYDKTSFSQKNDTLKTLLNGEEVRVGVFSYISVSILSAVQERKLEYVPMKIMHNNAAALFKRTMPTNRYFITKDCEHPEVAFRIADYMCSPTMTKWSIFGEPGVDWVDAPADAESLYDFLGYKASIECVLVWGSRQNSHWQNNVPGFRTRELDFITTASNDDSTRAKAKAVELLYDQYPEEGTIVDKIVYSVDEIEERASILPQIKTYVKQMRYQFIVGEVDIDEGWNDYIKELKSINMDRSLEISQTAYDRMN